MELCALPAFADTRDNVLASFLSNNILFLSQINALKYVPAYRENYKRCMEEEPLTDKQCRSLSLEKINQQAKAEHPHEYLIYRINKLSKDGHLSHFKLPVEGPTFGIAGDSISTGAVSDLKLEPRLWKLFFYNGLWDFLFVGNSGTSVETMQYLQSSEFDFLKKQPVQAPLRIFDTPDKHKEGNSRKYENLGSAFVDCEECSFGYLLGRKLGFPASNIFMAGQDGTDIDGLLNQLERLALPLERLPEVVLVTYTASLYCGGNSGKQTPEQVYNEYYSYMTEQMKTALQKLTAAPHGTQFLIISSADVANHLTNEAILNHKVNYYPYVNPTQPLEQVSCRQIRKNQVPMSEKINNMCKFVLNTDPDDSQRVRLIEQFNQAEIRAQQQSVMDLQNWIVKNNLQNKFSISFIKETPEVEFTGDDVANECFHPSIRGQEKIAEKLLLPIQKQLKSFD